MRIGGSDKKGRGSQAEKSVYDHDGSRRRMCNLADRAMLEIRDRSARVHMKSLRGQSDPQQAEASEYHPTLPGP